MNVSYRRWKYKVLVSVILISYIFFCTISVYYLAFVRTRADECGDDSLWRPDDIKWVPAPLKDEDLSSVWQQTDERHIAVCPENSPNLVGPLKVTSKTVAREVYNSTSVGLLKPGGFYTPTSCKAMERVAIIIPYRDRRKHLQILLLHLHTVLQRQQLQYAIFVLELAHPTQFNRGLLANVGYLTAREIQNFTCYIIHDVDLLPADDNNLYRCGKQPRHLAASSSNYGYRLPYEHYIGGVIALTPAQFKKLNGFSNAYFGWGKEDDDLFRRISSAGYKIDRPKPNVGVYEAIEHTNDFTNPDNPMKDGLLLRAEKRMMHDGVNRVIYSRLALEFRPLYTCVYVSTSETLVMEIIYSRDPVLKTAYAKLKEV